MPESHASYQVRLFAIARALVGTAAIEIRLPLNPVVKDLKAALVAAVPQLATVIGTCKFSVNAEYADDSTPIPPGAELAVIPPVSGG